MAATGTKERFCSEDDAVGSPLYRRGESLIRSHFQPWELYEIKNPLIKNISLNKKLKIFA